MIYNFFYDTFAQQYHGVMTWLKYKSDENLISAKILLDNKMYASCIHCYYYACLQLTKKALNDKLKISYKKQDDTKEDSHKFVISKLYEDFKRKDKTKANVFSRCIDDLKYLRTKADYKNVQILDRDAFSAKNKSDSVIKLIKEQYA